MTLSVFYSINSRLVVTRVEMTISNFNSQILLFFKFMFLKVHHQRTAL